MKNFQGKPILTVWCAQNSDLGKGQTVKFLIDNLELGRI